MNHMYIMSIFSSFFLKKILLFHLGNEILSLVVHWGMKVMDMTKKTYLRSESYIDRRAKESRQLILLSFVFSVSKIKNFKISKN